MSIAKNKTSLVMAIALSLGCCLTTDPLTVEATENDMSFVMEGITVEARPDWENKLSPGTVTVVHTDDYKGEQKTISDLLKTVPGVHVREVNGKGQYTTVTVRGSTAAQVGVFIDGVLSNLGGDSAVDLSTIPVQNVERIEVYRGYVPSRFGGTFIGGVVNIVTKKPTKPDVSLELGRSSYGGRKGAMELTAPLGEGSLMVGANYESSDGDFEYENYAAERAAINWQKAAEATESSIKSFDNNKILELNNTGLISDVAAEINSKYLNDSAAWMEYVNSEGLSSDIQMNSEVYASKKFDTLGWSDFKQSLIDDGIKDRYIKNDRYNENNWTQGVEADWNKIKNGTDGVILKKEDVSKLKESYVSDYKTNGYLIEVEKFKNIATHDSDEMKALEKKLKDEKKKLTEAKNAKRKRKYNDYENTNTFVKWQSDDLVVKGTYSKIDRHLPDGLWGDSALDADINTSVDLYDTYWWESRRQIVESTGLMLQNRHSVGKLELGWLVDYLHKDSNYRAENIYPPATDQISYQQTPMREWSEYKSNKYNTQIDGSYKFGEKSMLDFQMNYSKERMDVDGSNMKEIISGVTENAGYAQMRDRYDQEIFNFQLQNSITLDKKGSWIVTPAIRYNQSKITGYSNGSRFDKGYFGWIKPKEEQTDSKVTWQLALKKEFSDEFSMRMTGGTYYRLLNMSEIAGDGAGILPAPADQNGKGSVFPLPEEGKQFDISAVMNSRLLGADNRTTLTYFWRDSENMLQLYRAGKDFWSYFNDNKGRTNGVELLSSFGWNKFDLDMQVTYLNSKMERKNSAVKYDFAEVWPTHQPEWEGNVRLTYRPSEKFSIFTEAHYTDEYFTSAAKNGTGEEAYLSGRPMSELLTINGGIKWQPRKNWQLTFGCNDIFDEGPKMKIKTGAPFEDGVVGYINPEFPIQGRTYYITAKASF